MTLFGGDSENDDNPLSGRSRFSRRHLHNWLKAVSIFTAVAIALAVFVPWLEWLGEAGAGLILGYLLFYVWVKEPVWIKCNHCGEMITSKTPWVCGIEECKKQNRNIDAFPFLNQCEHCGAEPKAYECHHCGKNVFLTQDQQEEGYAFSIGSKFQRKPPPIPPPPVKDEVAEHKRAIEAINVQIERLEREAKLAEAELALKKVRGEKVPLEEDGEAKHLIHMGRLIVSRQKIARAKVDLKDDPEALERTIKFWEGWKDELSL